ncbi:ABC transporter substrate-binding protein [Patescibacteria group bacterium]
MSFNRLIGKFKTGFKILNWRRLWLFKKHLSVVEQIIVVALIVVALGSAGWWATRSYLGRTISVPAIGGTYTEGMVGSPKYVNPILAQTNEVDLDLSKLVFSSLMSYDENRVLAYQLATNYEISEDLKTYTFTLRDDVKWHDGEPLTAHDVVFTVESIQDQAFNSPLRLGFKSVVVEAPDDLTVSFTLKDPFVPFVHQLTFGILPAHIWGEIPAASASLAEYNQKPIGSGPFKFEELKKNQEGDIRVYKLTAFRDYFEGRPYLDEITLRFYDNFDDLIVAYNDKDVEGVHFLPANFQERLKRPTKTQIFDLNLPSYQAIFFNKNNNSHLTTKVRTALSQAINRDHLIQEGLLGAATAIYSPFVPGALGYNEGLAQPEYNSGLAGILLGQEGWAYAEEDGIRKKDGKPLTVNLTVQRGTETNSIAELIKEAWSNIGVVVNIVEMEVAELQTTLRDRDYEALLYGQLIGADADIYPFWHSTQTQDPGLALTSYSNSDMDKYLEDARKEENSKKRRELHNKIEKILVADQPAIFLFSPLYLYALESSVKGIIADKIVLPSDRFFNVSKWYRRTTRINKAEEEPKETGDEATEEQPAEEPATEETTTESTETQE